MNEVHASKRTLQAKRELALLLQQQAEVKAILSGEKIGENVLGLIRSEGNIMPEYREELEADIAIGRERKIIAKGIGEIIFPPAGYFREKSEKNIKRVQEVITSQMQEYYDLQDKKGVENFEVSDLGTSVSAEYLGVSFCITLVGWGKIKIQTQDKDFDTIVAFLKTVQKMVLEKTGIPLTRKIVQAGGDIDIYSISVKFQRFLNSTYSLQIGLSKRVFVFRKGIGICFHEGYLSAFLNGRLKSKDTIVIPQDDFYDSMYHYLIQIENIV